MALDDFRRWITLNPRSAGAVMLEATARNARGSSEIEPTLRLTVQQDEDGVVELELDWSDAGLIVDALREGMAVLLARMGNPVAAAASAGLRLVADTPTPGSTAAPSDRSGRV